MDDVFIVSELDVCFTKRTVDVMRCYAEDLSRKNVHAISWSVAFGRDGELIIGLGGDYQPQPLAIADKVDGFVFYWYADPPGLEAVRKYCIDKTWDSPSRLLDLPQGMSND